ncbi:MAG: hypothetical protein IPL26_16315 [Leptospiraceae bacterium]|nr:hypothetical protein [Leptospiraceae bacterium]
MTNKSKTEKEEFPNKTNDVITEVNKAELDNMFPEHDINEVLEEMDLNIVESSIGEPKFSDNPLVNPFSIADERRYITDLIKSIQKNKDRIVSTLANVKNSRIFELTGEPADSKNTMSNLSREFDSEVYRIIDNLQNRFKEISNFPKSINHYSMNYSLKQKDFLATLENDKIRLDYILRWEMQEPSLLLIKKFAKMVSNLLAVLNTKEDEQIKSLSFQQQSIFRDSKSAAEYCLNDLDFLKRSVENWENSAV